MTQTYQAELLVDNEDRSYAETPFAEPRNERYEMPAQNEVVVSEMSANHLWNFETPFETAESYEVGDGKSEAPEIAALAEITADLKDHEFRESLEALATEALEANAEQLEGEYGDREMRDASSERLLGDHFVPLGARADALLDRFFEQLEGYETEALSDTELERIVEGLLPSASGYAPASDQFLGGLLRKAGRLVSGAVNLAKRGVEGAIGLAGKGLAALGKLALGPLLRGLKMLAKYLLKHVVSFALNQLPPALRPMGKQLSDRLFQAIGETQEHELNDREQNEAESVPAGVDVARLEAEFDVAAAQLLLTPEEAESQYVTETYGEVSSDRSMSELDDARARLTGELERLEAGESAQPLMEQFIPAALWPIAKTAITVLGRPKLVGFLGNLLGGLVKPMIGAQAAGLLAPAIADAGLRIFGLEAEAQAADPRALAAEALAATVEETINRINEFPVTTFENETVFEASVRDAFEDAAATYFPNSHIKGELQEVSERPGLWMRMPYGSHRKRYAKYSAKIPTTISPRVADSIETFGNATLRDHLRDRLDVSTTAPLQTNVRLFQVLPGSTTSSIARAEGINPRDLHPLTPYAAAALLGPSNAGLGPRTIAPGVQLSTPHRLQLRQRLYYIEPPSGRMHSVRAQARLARSEVSIDLRKGEIRLWFYMSEPLVQRVTAEMKRSGNAATAFRLVHPLVVRASGMLKSALMVRRLPPALRVIGETPNFDSRLPAWLSVVGTRFAAKIAEWASVAVATYLRNNAEQFRRASASERDGVTLRLTLSRIPGIDVLRQIASGKVPRHAQGSAWLRGEPTFVAIATPGYAIR